ncbi:hypothetical protein F5148DRAFT_1150788 [Russula earlei]|uniref:Uncharacterized protein n=1 Tax=Russula earlei TaxID=71964 RepID=A0ACC0U2S2_9AGAM|nr:hypothetical protein F5148DRAFT_1150788 [Russula earlei]
MECRYHRGIGMMKGFIVTIIVCTFQCKVPVLLTQTVNVTIENLNCFPVSQFLGFRFPETGKPAETNKTQEFFLWFADAVYPSILLLVLAPKKTTIFPLYAFLFYDFTVTSTIHLMIMHISPAFVIFCLTVRLPPSFAALGSRFEGWKRKVQYYFDWQYRLHKTPIPGFPKHVRDLKNKTWILDAEATPEQSKEWEEYLINQSVLFGVVMGMCVVRKVGW